LYEGIVVSVSAANRKLSPVTMFAERQLVLTVTGQLDVTTAPDLERIVADQLDGDTDILVLELSEVSAFDQAGLDALLRTRAACEDLSVVLRVVPGDVVRQVMTSTRTIDHFSLAEPR
jgi:anti-anti-sigma factor